MKSINQIENEDKLLEFIYNNRVDEFKKSIDEIIISNKLSNYSEEDLFNLIQYLDLTSLKSTDNNKTITEFVKNSVLTCKSNNYYVGGICCYSPFLSQINDCKPSKKIKSVVVAAGFPHSQVPLSVKKEEIKYAIENNVDEIDICLNRGLFFDENKEKAAQEIREIKDLLNLADKNIVLKVILEVGELQTYNNIMEASTLCLENGADFIKTSTGKIEKGADIYSSTVMLLALREYYRKNNVLKGLKVAGGIRKIKEAVEYMNLYKYFITSNFDNNSFRIGCSQLFDKIKEELLKNN
jgi:deoxyribose-phosphate aldolase